MLQSVIHEHPYQKSFFRIRCKLEKLNEKKWIKVFYGILRFPAC
jgi:hypothetical protein